MAPAVAGLGQWSPAGPRVLLLLEAGGRGAIFSAGVSALAPPRLLTTALCNERRPQARTAMDLLTSRAFGALGFMEASLMSATLYECVAALVNLMCTPAGQRRVVRAAQL